MSAWPSPARSPAASGPRSGLGLLSAALVSAVVALVWRYPGSMGVVSPEATLVIGTVGLGFVGAVAPAQQLPTLMATVALVTLALGAMLLILARARLGYLMHYLPFPVVAGLIGGLGVLLVIGGLELAVPGLRAGDAAFWAGNGYELAATAAFGTLVWLIQDRWPGTLNLPVAGHGRGSAVLARAGSPAARRLAAAGHSTVDRRTRLRDSLWRSLSAVDWRAIAAASPTLAMLVVFLAVVVLADAATWSGARPAPGAERDPARLRHRQRWRRRRSAASRR